AGWGVEAGHAQPKGEVALVRGGLPGGREVCAALCKWRCRGRGGSRRPACTRTAAKVAGDLAFLGRSSGLTRSGVAQWWSARLLTERLRVRVPPPELLGTSRREPARRVQGGPLDEVGRARRPVVGLRPLRDRQGASAELRLREPPPRR